MGEFLNEIFSLTQSFDLNFEVLAIEQVFAPFVRDPNGVQSFVSRWYSLSLQELIQNRNNQKKALKKEINSNTIINENVFKVIEAWNYRFNKKININELLMVSHIKKALSEFNVEEIVEAMENRLEAVYYKTKKPELLHNPKCFFPYLDTIKNDLGRSGKELYNYDKKISLITSGKYRDEQFVIRYDIKDKKGRPMWELNK